MRALLLAALVAVPAAAQEGDPPVTVNGAPLAGPWPMRPASGPGAGELGPSDPFTEPYDSVLFHGELPDARVGFEVTREEAAGWSPWTPALLKREADGRFWAKAVFPTPGTGRLRLRSVGPAGPVPAAVTLYGVQVFLSAAKPPAPAPGPHRPAGADTIGVIERQAWGAKPPKNPYDAHEPKKLTQHHTAGRRPATLSESLAEMRFLQDFHQNGRGWNDIGYHFLVDAEGRVFRGRPVTAVGAHVKDDNTGNVGVSFMGTHHPPFNHPVTAEQLDAVVRIGRWLEAEFSVGPATYAGHRDRGKSDCPGDILYAQLEKVRAAWRAPEPSVGEKLKRWWDSAVGNIRKQ